MGLVWAPLPIVGKSADVHTPAFPRTAIPNARIQRVGNPVRATSSLTGISGRPDGIYTQYIPLRERQGGGATMETGQEGPRLALFSTLPRRPCIGPLPPVRVRDQTNLRILGYSTWGRAARIPPLGGRRGPIPPRALAREPRLRPPNMRVALAARP